jgi:hypothetical protein
VPSPARAQPQPVFDPYANPRTFRVGLTYTRAESERIAKRDALAHARAEQFAKRWAKRHAYAARHPRAARAFDFARHLRDTIAIYARTIGWTDPYPNAHYHPHP